MKWMLLIAVSVLGALLAKKLRLPAAGMLGAIAGTVALQSLELVPIHATPVWVLVVLYAAIGLLLGLKFTRTSISYLQHVRLPALVVPGVMIFSGCAIGLLYRNLAITSFGAELDLTTTVLAITPGGFQEMSIAAQELNAELAIVILTHLLRVITVISVYPWFLKQIVQRTGYAHRMTAEQHSLGVLPASSSIAAATQYVTLKGTQHQVLSTVTKTRQKTPMVDNPATREPPAQGQCRIPRWLQWLIVGSGALAGSAAGRWMNIPAGAVLGAMFGALVFRTALGAEGLMVPNKIRFWLQIALGINLGLQFHLGPLAERVALVVPILTSLALLITIALATGWLIHKITRLDLPLSLWMTAPAGLSEITLLAEADGINPLPVLTVHLMRVVMIIAIQPTLVRYLVSVGL